MDYPCPSNSTTNAHSYESKKYIKIKKDQVNHF